jgi:hypothetical protein
MLAPRSPHDQGRFETLVMSWQRVVTTSAADLGPRFTLVGILPATFLAVFVIALSWSGPPARAPSWSRLLASARDLTAAEAALLVVGVLLTAILLQPMQRPLVRLLEGYWVHHARTPVWLGVLARQGEQRRFERLTVLAYARLGQDADRPPRQDRAAGGVSRWWRRIRAWCGAGPDAERARRAHHIDQILTAHTRLRLRYPPDPGRLLPTALGNALRAAEDTAGERYGLPTVAVWPALYAVLSPAVKAGVDDARTQLDVTVRLCAALTFAAPVSVIMLWRFRWWAALFAALALLLARLAYLAAVAAAESLGRMIYLSFDLHRFDLLTALHVALPADSAQERRINRRLATRLTRDPDLLISYRHPDCPQST